jgi:hypothetical protein
MAKVTYLLEKMNRKCGKQRSQSGSQSAYLTTRLSTAH